LFEFGFPARRLVLRILNEFRVIHRYTGSSRRASCLHTCRTDERFPRMALREYIDCFGVGWVIQSRERR
jgi:hypothetical protein